VGLPRKAEGPVGRSGRCESEVRNKERWPRLTHTPSWQGGGRGQVRSSDRLCTGWLGWPRERRKIARLKTWHWPKRQMKIRGRQSSMNGTRKWSRWKNRRIWHKWWRVGTMELIPNLKRGIKNWRWETRRGRR
jgi:hypothetical protein